MAQPCLFPLHPYHYNQNSSKHVLKYFVCGIPALLSLQLCALILQADVGAWTATAAGMVEARQQQVSLPHVSGEILELLLRFMYWGSCQVCTWRCSMHLVPGSQQLCEDTSGQQQRPPIPPGAGRVHGTRSFGGLSAASTSCMNVCDRHLAATV
jgi:hypothetical protein